MTPSRTVQTLSGSALLLGSTNFLQPVKSLPLNSRTQPSPFSCAGPRAAAPSSASAVSAAAIPIVLRPMLRLLDRSRGSETTGILAGVPSQDRSENLLHLPAPPLHWTTGGAGGRRLLRRCADGRVIDRPRHGLGGPGRPGGGRRAEGPRPARARLRPGADARPGGRRGRRPHRRRGRPP